MSMLKRISKDKIVLISDTVESRVFKNFAETLYLLNTDDVNIVIKDLNTTNVADRSIYMDENENQFILNFIKDHAYDPFMNDYSYVGNSSYVPYTREL